MISLKKHSRALTPRNAIGKTGSDQAQTSLTPHDDGGEGGGGGGGSTPVDLTMRDKMARDKLFSHSWRA